MISIVYDSKRFRSLMAGSVKDGWTVIEVGPHVGEATRLYVERTKKTLAVDIGEQSEKAFAKMCAARPNLSFVRGDARCFETVAKARKVVDRCDLLSVDMGGGRFPDTVFKVWAIWSGVFRPEHSIIRNRGLAEFVQRAKVSDESVTRDFPDSGWLSVWGRTVPSKLKPQLDEFSLWASVKKGL